MTEGTLQHDSHRIFGLLQSGAHMFGVSTEELAEVLPIAHLSPYPSTQRAVLGSISVRGVLIPVLDPLVLCGLPPGTDQPKIAALLRNEHSIVALGMDQVLELRRVAAHTLQVVESATGQELVNMFLLTNDGQVNILSAQALFSQSALPFASRRPQVKETQGSRDVRPHLTFESSGVSYAIAVSDLFNTIPRRDLEATDVASGAFLGKVTYHGRTIPVLDMNTLVDMAAPRSQHALEMVVVHVEQDRLVGLAVDQISRIEYFHVAKIIDVPTRMQTAMPLVKATYKSKDAAAHTLIIDADQIAKLPAIEGVARMSKTMAAEQPTEPVFKTNRTDIIRERNRNLVFSAGSEFAVPVQEIRDVLPTPKEVTPWQTGTLGLRGLFFFRDRMTPLIHMGEYLGNHSDEEAQDQYVLVCGTDEMVVGFQVDRIRGILQSEWQGTSTQETGYQMVNVVDRGTSWLCPRLPLEALAEDVMKTLSALDKGAA